MKTLLRLLFLAVALPLTAQNISIQKTPAGVLTDPAKVFVVPSGGSITATGNGIIDASKVSRISILPTAPLTGGGALTGNVTIGLPVGNVTESTSAVLTITGGSGAVVGNGTTIQVKQAGTAQNGYLSLTDWNTFNAKQPAGNYITALTGDGTAAGPGNVTFTLATVLGTPGAVGTATAAPVVTFNAKGLATATGTVTITPAVTSITGLGTGIATFLATPSSANLATAVTDETGTEALVFANSPNLTTPHFAQIVNTGTLTLPTSTDTLVGRATTDTLTNKTLTAPVIATIVNTGTVTLPTATDTLVARATSDTLTNKSMSGATNTFTNIPNSGLANATVTIGTTTIALGGTASTVTGLASPTQATDAATKGYVDAAVYGLDWKASVRAATTANITLTGTQTIDGVVLIVGDRVLVWKQTDATTNGLYLVASGAWTRTADATTGTISTGLTTFVSEGTLYGKCAFTLTTSDPITIGSTALTFVQVTGPNLYTAGTGINITGNAISTSAVPNASLANSTITIAGTSTALGGSITLDTIDGLAATGMIARTAANTRAARTITGTANQITVTNGDGVAGNPTLSLPSAITLPGSLSVTTTLGVTGNLTVSGPLSSFGPASGASEVKTTGTAGNLRIFSSYTGSNFRWYWGANTTAESGSNVGSDWVLVAGSDIGVTLSTPLTVTRATGAIATSAALTVGGNLTVSGTGQNPFGSAFTPSVWGVPSLDVNGSVGSLYAVYYNGTAEGYFGTTASGSVVLVKQSGGSVTMGNLSQASWTTNGALAKFSGNTFTNTSTTAGGTAASAVFTSFAAPTLAATNASVTTTDAATVYIGGPPSAGTNQTITNAWALWANGNVKVGGTGASTIGGNLQFTNPNLIGSASNVWIGGNGSTGLALNAPSGASVLIAVNNTAAATFNSTSTLLAGNLTVSGTANTIAGDTTLSGTAGTGGNGYIVGPSAAGKELRLQIGNTTGFVTIKNSGGTDIATFNGSNSLTSLNGNLTVIGTGSLASITTTNGFSSPTTNTGLNLTGANVGMEVGAVGTANTPYIDFHSSASSTDYDARISASGGTASNGAGTLTINVASLVASGNLTVSGTGSFAGAITTGATVTMTNASATNGVNYNAYTSNIGTDGTLGALQVTIGGNPSATGNSRFGYITVGDSGAFRKMFLNGLGTGNGGVVAMENATDATTGGAGSLTTAGGIYAAKKGVFGGYVDIVGTPSSPASGHGQYGGDSALGAQITGHGSVYDVSLLNTSGNGVIQVPTGTTNALFSGAIIMSVSAPPATASSTGTTGTIAWDTGFVYVCTATNTWKRSAISTF